MIFQVNSEILSTKYRMMEHFYTLQGEGYWAGTPAYFIRLAGCNVGCHWCDVKESWNENEHPSFSVEEILDFIVLTPAQKVVITGGEPLQHNLFALTHALKFYNFKLHLETSGVYPISGYFDWICLSPKKFKKPVPEIYSFVHELKIIIYHPSDFDFAEEHAKMCPSDTLLFLQPEWSRKEKVLPMMIEYVKKNPQWRISLQTHKYLNIP